MCREREECDPGALMKRLAGFPLDQGGTVLVEVEDAPGGGPVTRGLGRDRPGLVERTDRTVEEATATVTPAAWSAGCGRWTTRRRRSASSSASS